MSHPILQNKVIVVVGGTTGLGLSAAVACVAADAKVVVVGRSQKNVDAASRTLGKRALCIAGDATDSGVAAVAIEAAIERFGRFDGLYHVAGGSGRRAGDGPLDEISDEGWDFTFGLNLTSLFYSNRAAARQFLKTATGGSVLNMGSVLAASPSPRYFATHAYAAAKSAVTGLTLSCAAYYAAKNIRFNQIVPALVKTPMSQRACDDSDIGKFIASKQPLDGGRVGTPADLDAAVVFFLSDQSRFVTGQSLAIDGGWCVTEGQYEAGETGN